MVARLILSEFILDRMEGERALIKRVELISAGAIGSFHTAVVFGFFRGEYIQGDIQVLAGLFELGHKLTAAIDLDRADRERYLLAQGLQKVSGRATGRPAVYPQDTPFRDRTDGLELLEGLALGERQTHVIHLTPCSGLLAFHPVSPALGMAPEHPPPLGFPPSEVKRHWLNLPAPHPLAYNAPNCTLTQRPVLRPNQHPPQLALAP